MCLACKAPITTFLSPQGEGTGNEISLDKDFFRQRLDKGAKHLYRIVPML